MKKLVIAAVFAIAPATAFAAMDDLKFIQEISALGHAVALQEPCQIRIDEDAMANYVAKEFAGRESEVLSQLSGMTTAAKYQLEQASELEKKLLCKSAQQYVEKHKLAPAS